MQYRFCGDELELVKYEITTKKILGGKEYTRVDTAATDEERDNILKTFPDAIVTPVDNTGYEWLNGRVFTQSELRTGELDKAIELGEKAYEQQKRDNDPEYRLKVMEEALIELAEMIGG